MILSLLNSLKKANRIIFQLAKKGLINGAEGIRILLSTLTKGAIKGLIINALVFALISILIITITVGAVSELVNSIINKIGGWFGYKGTMATYNEELTNQEVEELLEYGVNVNPKNLAEYENMEKLSCSIKNHLPNELYKVKVPMKVWTYVKTPHGTSFKQDKIDYILDLESRVKPYRLRWELIMGIDILKEKATKENPETRDYIKDLKEKLGPEFYWDFNKYTKDVIITTKYYEKKYRNGHLEYDTWRKTVETTSFYPLDIPVNNLDATVDISGVFKDYDFVVKEDELVYDEPFSDEIIYDRYSWIQKEWTGKYLKDNTGHFIVDENGNKVKEYNYVSYEIVKYKKVKRKIKEDIITRIEAKVNNKLREYMLNNNMSIQDLEILYFIIEQIPNTSLLLEDLDDVIDYYSMEQAENLDYYLNLQNINIEIDPSQIEKVADIPYFSQRDERWAYLPYGNARYYPDNTIKRTGCGTTCMAMVAMGLGGYSKKVDLNNDGILDPYEISKWSYEHGYKVEPTGGTYWSFFPVFAKEVGLTVEQYSPSQYEIVKQELLKGNPVIASMKPPTFTSSGHFIVLVGFDKDGKVIVNDPNSKARSYPQSKWDFANPIVAESKGFFVFKKK